MKINYKYQILLVIFILAFLSSFILAIKESPPLCAENCDIVQTSKYATTLGIKNSAYGVGIFAFMSFLAFSHIKNPAKIKKNFIYLGIIISSIVSIYFLYLQYFVIKAFCQYCLVVDIGMLISLAIILIEEK